MFEDKNAGDSTIVGEAEAHGRGYTYDIVESMATCDRNWLTWVATTDH